MNPMAAACYVSHYNMVSGHAYGIVGYVQLSDIGDKKGH